MEFKQFYVLSVSLSFLVGLLCWREKKTNIGMILILLEITLAIELTEMYFKSIIWHHINYLYFTYGAIEYLILFYVFFREIKYKKLTLSIGIIVGLLFMYCLFFSNYQSLVGNIFKIHGFWVIYLTVVFFYSLLMKENYENLYRIPLFWIAVGLFIYYTVSMVIQVTIGYLYNIDRALANKLFYAINSSANIVMYLLFTIGFLCQSRFMQKRLSSLP